MNTALNRFFVLRYLSRRSTCIRSGISVISAAAIALAGVATARTPPPNRSCAAPDNVSADSNLAEEFSGTELDDCVWVAVQGNWGGKIAGEDYNGGVVAENVSLQAGMLRLVVHGNEYAGPSKGINLDGTRRKDGRRSGAAIKTRQLFLGGRFEARVKIIEQLGVASAMWTYFNDHPTGSAVRNHEIDIEFPGREQENSPPSFKFACLTTWTGLDPGQSTFENVPVTTSPANDGFHIVRFDWQPPLARREGFVSFYIDDRPVGISRTNIPSEPGNLWLGAWFPQQWAGTPEFDEAEMLIDWVRVSPLSVP